MDLKHVLAFATAIATAMRHPDPAAWAKEVAEAFQLPTDEPVATAEKAPEGASQDGAGAAPAAEAVASTKAPATADPEPGTAQPETPVAEAAADSQAPQA